MLKFFDKYVNFEISLQRNKQVSILGIFSNFNDFMNRH